MRLDYVFFVYGLSFVLLASMLWRHKWLRDTAVPWKWLALFALLHGVKEWLDMVALSTGTHPAFATAQTAFLVCAFVALAEFARRGLTGHAGFPAGPWLYLPSLALMAFGSLHGLAGLEATSRYGLALPGALAAGYLVVAEARRSSGRRRSGLALVAAAVIVYGTAAGLVGPEAPFFPASVLNASSFAETVGVPVQFFRAACTVAAACGLALATAPGRTRRHGGLLNRPWVAAAATAALACAGFAGAEWHGQAMDARLRTQLLSEATGLADTVDPEDAKALSFSPEDSGNPVYRRLCEQFMTYARAKGLLSVYTQALRDGQIYFGPESLAPDDAMASLPGTVYRNPSQPNLRVFETAEPYTEGPYTDEYGTFVSALAPVTDPQTGRVLMVIGIDLHADAWRTAVLRERLLPILLTLALVFVMLGGRALLAWRESMPRAWADRLRHVEAGLVIATGAVITAAAADIAYDSAIHYRSSVFSLLAEANAQAIVREMKQLGSDSLVGLADFIGAEPRLSRRQFGDYLKPLRSGSMEKAWAWAPAVPAGEAVRFEQDVRDEGFPGYSVYRKDPRGNRLPATAQGIHYPVLYFEPLGGNEEVLGFDVASEPIRKAAMDAAAQTGHVAVTAPLVLVNDRQGEPSLVAFCPVFDAPSGSATRALKGFALEAVRVEGVLRQALSGIGSAASPVRVELYQLSTQQAPRLLAASPPGDVPVHARSVVSPDSHDSDRMFVAPLFIGGSTYAAVIGPGAGFPLDRASLASGLAVAVGGLLTVLVTLLIGFGSNRRAALARQVMARTAELRTRERAYRRQFVDNSTIMLLLDPADGRIVDANRTAVEFYGFPRSRLLDLRLSDLEALPAAGRSDTSTLAACEDGSRVEVQHRLADGRVRVLGISGSRLLFGGRPVLHAIATDVTSQHEAELALRLSETRLRAITDSAEDAIVMMDPRGRITFWNPAAERILGYASEEALGQDLHDLVTPERYCAAFRKAFPEFLRTGRGAAVGKTLDLSARRKDGREISVALSLSAVQLEAGWHAVGILRDTTAMKRAEEELREMNGQLELATARANDMALQAELASIAKSEFLANMSHEIRTPMNGVIGMTGLLLDTPLSPEQRRYAEIVRGSAEALLSLIGDILDFSKIEARKLDLETLDFDLRTNLEETAELLAVKAHEKGFELSCLIEPAVPTLLRGDPGRLRQILINLGGNAVKFTHKGWVVIRVSLESESDRYVTLRFGVDDTGIGIPEEAQSRLFAPFTQVDGSTTRRYGGTGLGLAISKQLAELMGGNIGLESEVGKGTSFWFTARFEKQPAAAGRSEETLVDVRGARVLVVDDNETNRLLVTTLLKTWGCRHAEAADGPTALDLLHAAALEDDPYRAAFVDMLMPGMDGLQLGARIKAEPAIRNVRLIGMTSLGEKGEFERFAKAGFCGCLSKPLRQAQLRQSLVLALRPGTLKPVPVSASSVAPAETGMRRLKARILVAEDNPTNQLVALKMLEKLGCRADAVANGREAVTALQSIPYDLVLMDCQMPEMDGFEAARTIRSGKSGVCDPHVPIVAMTANAMTGDRELCLEAGMDDYLSKPVTPAALAATVDLWLSRITAPQAPAQPAARDPLTPACPSDEGQGPRVFNAEAFVERLMGDVDLAVAVADGFLGDIPTQLEILVAAATAGDLDTAAQQAHKIKGAAANVGGEAMSATAAAIEHEAREAHAIPVKTLLPELAGRFDLLEAEMRAFMRRCGAEAERSRA